jgi:hypothetical protein
MASEVIGLPPPNPSCHGVAEPRGWRMKGPATGKESSHKRLMFPELPRPRADCVGRAWGAKSEGPKMKMMHRKVATDLASATATHKKAETRMENTKTGHMRCARSRTTEVRSHARLLQRSALSVV